MPNIFLQIKDEGSNKVRFIIVVHEDDGVENEVETHSSLIYLPCTATDACTIIYQSHTHSFSS